MFKKIALRFAIAFAYSLLGGITFYITFNYVMDWNLVRRRIADELSRLTGYDVKLSSVSLSGLSGLELGGLVFEERNPKNPDQPTRIKASSLKLDVELFNVLRGRRAVAFDADTLGGRIQGRVVEEKKRRRVDLNIENIKVDQIPGMSSAITLPLTGRLDVRGFFDLPPDGLKSADGKIRLSCKKCVMGDGKAKVKASFVATPNDPGSAAWAKEGFTLPPLSLGKFEGEVEIKKGKATFRDIAANSPDGEAELSGYITFRTPIKFSTTNLYFRFKFSDDVKKRHPNLEGIELSLAARGKRADGSFGISMTGQLHSMRFLPARTGVKDFARPDNDSKLEVKPGGGHFEKTNDKPSEKIGDKIRSRRERAATPMLEGEK